MPPQELPEVVLILAGSTFIILILLSLIVVSLLINQKRRFRNARELAEMKGTYEREVLRTQLETHLQTLAAISRELHDHVGTVVSMAIIHLQMLQAIELPTPATHKLNEVHDLLRESMMALRDLSQSINPDNMDKAGLIFALNKEIEKIKRINIFAIDFAVTGSEFPIDPYHQIIIFRIVQEAFHNIIKHAGATSVQVQMNYSDSTLGIAIKDNGVGFGRSPEVYLDSADNSGIKNMFKRAKLINATIDIQTSPNGGTTLQLVHRNRI